MTALARVLGLDDDEFEIYRDYQAHGMLDGPRLLPLVRREVQRRRRGEPPITGTMVHKASAMMRHPDHA
jgi:hypothetical protein